MTEQKPAQQPVASLADIRDEIDRIDAAMHALLIERSAVISDLIAIKKVAAVDTDDPVRRRSAFRPAREAAMMRAMIERHAGMLPLDTVESIWRVIISTFTYVQAPYEVLYARGSKPLLMRDVARFHFGYTVPVVEHIDAAGVIEGVGPRGDALGLVPLREVGAWWAALEGPDAPKVIARLPFVQRSDHPAGLPCLVLANAPADPEVMAAHVLSAEVNGAVVWPADVEVLASTAGRALVSVPDAEVAERLSMLAGVQSAVSVGAHAPEFHP